MNVEVKVNRSRLGLCELRVAGQHIGEFCVVSITKIETSFLLCVMSRCLVVVFLILITRQFASATVM